MTCVLYRLERNRVLSYFVEVFIGKTFFNLEQRMGILIQGFRVLDQFEMRSYFDVFRNKSLVIYNMQSRVDYIVVLDIRFFDCQIFKLSGVS